MQAIITMMDQFEKKHGRKPENIVITPYAAMALTLQQGMSAKCNGIPMVGKDFGEEDVCKEEGDVARNLGVFVFKNRMVSCDLKQ